MTYSAKLTPELTLGCFSITVLSQKGEEVCYNFLTRRWENAKTGEAAKVKKWTYPEPKPISEYLAEFEEAVKENL